MKLICLLSVLFLLSALPAPSFNLNRNIMPSSVHAFSTLEDLSRLDIFRHYPHTGGLLCDPVVILINLLYSAVYDKIKTDKRKKQNDKDHCQQHKYGTV